MRIHIQLKGLLLLVLLMAQPGRILLQESERELATETQATTETIGGKFSVEDMQRLEEQSEHHEFQAEVGRLMDIIINSLYTQKEIFLRELISNASDALDKIRFMAVSNPEVLGEKQELAIHVEYDNEAKTLSVIDSGVGMTKQELVTNLGTVAKSGSTQFIEAIKGGNLNLIGQFGVGFYSTFLVGSKVQVTSKSNDDDEQHIWESSAAHSFIVSEDPRGNTLKRGTKVTLFLKQDSYDFAEEDKIKSLIKKYSEFINFPIYLRVQKEVTKEVPVDDEPEEEPELEEEKEEEILDKEEEKKDEEDDEFEVKEEPDEKKQEDEQPKEKKMKTIKEKVWEWILVNDAKAIWLRSKEEIEEDEYNKFYKSLTKDYDDPLNYIHFKAEGEVEFRSILFIPKRAPYDLFENYYGRSSSLKLYVRRVLINEEFEDLMPKYLNFIKGVVDSDELPLNVSRETLQQLKMMKVISRKLVRKTIEMIKKLAETEEDDDEDEDDEDEEDEEDEDEEQAEAQKQEEEEKDEDEQDDEANEQEKKKKEKLSRYMTFWKEFGKNIKLGIIEDPGNRSKLAKLSRWYSSRNMTELTSFDEYLERAKSGQDYIYFIAGEDKDVLMKSPVLQALLKKGYEVLLLDDPIDEFCFQHLNEYEKKKLMNVAKGEFRFPDDDDSGRKRIKKLKKLYQPLTDWWKKLMNEVLENVVISQRLVNDPCVIVSTEHGTSANLERIQKAQAYANADKTAMNTQNKRLLEINPSHPIVKELLDRVKDNPDEETEEYAKMLTETALINSGYSVPNPNDFAKRFYALFNGAMGLPKDAPIEEVDISFDDEDDEKKKDQEEPEENNDQGEEEEEDEGKSKDEL